VTVHSTRLAAVGVHGAGSTLIYTVPAGKRAIVKSVVVANEAAAANHVSFSIVFGGGTGGFFACQPTASPGAGDTVYLLPWIVMNPGDELHVTVAVNSASILVSGTELTLP
jgi:hypothetical protein